MRIRSFGLSLGALILAATTGYAQAAWDSPQLMPSTVPAQPEFGIYLIDAAGAGVGVLGMWRGGVQPRMGLRFGLADEGRRRGPDRDDDGISAMGGVELMGTVTRATADFPLDITWVVGMGVGVSDRVRASFPAGLSVGHAFRGDGVMFNPYATPRVVLDGLFGDDGGLDLDLAVDIGIDIAFAPSWLIRFGGTFGDREAVALGIIF